MEVILLLVGAALVVAGGFLAALIWAIRNGQFDDMYTPSVRVLFDNDVDKSIDKENR